MVARRPGRRTAASKSRNGVYVSEALAVPPWEEGDTFYRADLEFVDVDHSGRSFEARVFVDHDRADLDTPTDLDNGYAGSFYVFGHGGCFGEQGHCEVPVGPLGAFDHRAPHPLAPQRKVVIATERIRALAEAGTESFRVTVVPVVPASVEGDADTVEDVLHFGRITLVTYL